MSERVTKFVDVILPVAIPNLFSYRVPQDLNDKLIVGQRVVVQFGKSKLYTAVVRSIHETPPTDYTAKYIQSILDDLPIVNEFQLKLWDWISKYYMCYRGEIMSAALPTSLKLASETKIVRNINFDRDLDILTDKEYLIFEALEVREILTIEEVGEILDQKTVYPVIKSLIAKRGALVEEELKEKFKPKMIDYVRLSDAMKDQNAFQEAFENLERAPKQLQVLMAFVELSRMYADNPMEVKKLPLQKRTGTTSSVINQLVQRGIFQTYQKEVGRLSSYEEELELSHELSDNQRVAYDKVNDTFNSRDVVLLQGVTSSGKTEVYIKLIEKCLHDGRQVLYLLPEIALTTQIINRLKKHFGDAIGVYHSRFSQNERVEIWNDLVAAKRYKIILGARSSVFLPFTDLGLIIVDEEHESSFKQYDPAPRYNARDTAIVLAGLHNAKVLLGSATPAIDTAYNANEGKYGKVLLTERFGGVQMPEVLTADIAVAARKRTMQGSFSPFLIKHIEEALANKEQIILFQNRRGFSPYIQCEICGEVPQCKQCDVSLTYHKIFDKLICHYCSSQSQNTSKCHACGSIEVKQKGFGTEKIEEEVQSIFPKAKALRMDLDTTRTKNAYQNILSQFEEREVDILIGTQMVTKGLDFDNVALVGILNADSMLNFPDFRAFERSYQLMSQVAGRAGRRAKKGKVVIQTYNPDHPIILDVIRSNYENMYANEMLDRRNYHYPPFYRLIKLTVKHKRVELVNSASAYLANSLRQVFSTRVLGPEFPSVARVRNYYHKQILLKFEKEISISNAKKLLENELNNLKRQSEFKSIRVIIDVDPL